MPWTISPKGGTDTRNITLGGPTNIDTAKISSGEAAVGKLFSRLKATP